MYRSRLFEEAVSALWDQGLISGEMHLGIGEEAIVAGTVSHLTEGDAMALDHRGSAAMLMRGVALRDLLLEFLGHPNGLCHGMGGHMHLFAPEVLAASSGIVGSSGPAAVGFALAAQQLRPGTVALAYFGEGAVNEGMMMESMNLASIWKLPVVFICKDNGWSITTASSQVTAGDLVRRAKAFDLKTAEVDGSEVLQVWHAAAEAIDRARKGCGPSFIHATCRHFEGHFSGYQLLRVSRDARSELGIVWPYLKSGLTLKGANFGQRVGSTKNFLSLIKQTRQESLAREDDPITRTRQSLAAEGLDLEQLEADVISEIQMLIEGVVE